MNPPSFSPEKDEIRLAGPLEIQQVSGLKRLFIQECALRASLIINLSQVTSCDAAGAQLLWSVKETVKHDGGVFLVRCAPKAVLACWAALGLPEDFFEPFEAGQTTGNSYSI
jgi:anti-anti-sigma regulatory factor